LDILIMVGVCVTLCFVCTIYFSSLLLLLSLSTDKNHSTQFWNYYFFITATLSDLSFSCTTTEIGSIILPFEAGS